MATNKIMSVSPRYGQLVIGPPGSGKTTYCSNMNKFLQKLDRKVEVVNLDPANENMEYITNIDIMNLITVTDVMEQMNLGPNGSLMYCIEFLEKNLDWLINLLKSSTNNYFIFDCPGQVELYTHHKSMSNIFKQIESLGYNLCVVNLIDSHYCSEPEKFISTVLLSLNTMLQMSQPHVNVLSKADLLKQYESKILFNLDFYTDVLDLNHLLDALDDIPQLKKYHKLSAAIVSMIEGYNLVSYVLLDINRIESIIRLKNLIDKANGYIYGAGEEKSVNTLLACAVGVESETERSKNDLDPYL